MATSDDPDPTTSGLPSDGSTPPPPEVPGGAGRPDRNRKAIYSVVCGCGAFLMLLVYPFAAVVLGFVAITSGFQARGEISQSHGEQTGDSLVVYGLMIGGVALVFGTIALALSLGP